MPSRPPSGQHPKIRVKRHPSRAENDPLLLRRVLNNPCSAREFSLNDWDLLVQQGYCSSLLARVKAQLDDQTVSIPSRVNIHLTSAQIRATAHSDDVRIEIEAIIKALKPAGITPVFLKGAAYVLAGDSASSGRLFSDVDIFIPKTQLGAAEQFLKWQGWQPEQLDAYDEHYYREWMHEIPALIHQQRGTALDVHHNLLPLIGRIKIDASLLQQTVTAGQLTLPAEDRLIHSATHLFCSGEFESGFRDLSDLNLMIREFGQEKDFWDKLLKRTAQLGVGRLLYYALRYCDHHFSSPIPDGALRQIGRYAPNPLTLKLMDWMFDRALIPHHSSCNKPFSSLGRILLLIRSHWLKMPLITLIPHLFRKAVINPIMHREDTIEQLKG
ncbi:MAG: nucleotidyltransferase family protein [Motiliproteus sp.]